VIKQIKLIQIVCFLPYVVNLIVLVVYFSLPRLHPLFDFSTFFVWPIVAFTLFAVLEVLTFSLQETTRQLVRIYLLQKSGMGYDDSLLPVYQLKLTPNWTVPIIPVYMVSQVASFSLLLFSFGWGVAVLAHVIAYAITIWIPIPYSLLMPSIKTHLVRSSEMVKFAAFTERFDTERFILLIDEALSERRNLGNWWAKILQEKLAGREEVEIKMERDSKRIDTYGLLGIADDAYQILRTFNETKDRFYDCRGGVFLEADPAINDINKCVTGIKNALAKLEETIPKLTNRPKDIKEVESDFCNTLGIYLCDLLNSMNAFLHFLRIHKATMPKFFLTRGWRRWKSLRDFHRHENARMRSGASMMTIYSIYNTRHQAS